MPRTARHAPGNRVYHVLNRGNGKLRLFHKPADYSAFMTLLSRVRTAVPGVRVLAWCLMPNHWHLVLYPRKEGELANFMLRLTTAHVRRTYAHRHITSGGHLYQGRYKSFPVQDDHHLLTLIRYVESNALRSNLSPTAHSWPFSSLHATLHAKQNDPTPDPWPVPRPPNWTATVNAILTRSELDHLHTCLKRGRPYGSDSWTHRTAAALGLDHTLRDHGRPRRRPTASEITRAANK